jgi:nucleoside 2-deoxyribosyltransferase
MGPSKRVPFVFVLMPFDDALNEMYQLAIKPACDAAGTRAERVDEQVVRGSIPQWIYNQIGAADYLIAEMSGKNANVFYETGYAHALGKTVLLLTRQKSDIPFDVQHYQHIVYDGLIELRDEIEKRLRSFVEQDGEFKASSEEYFTVNFDGLRGHSPEIPVRLDPYMTFQGFLDKMYKYVKSYVPPSSYGTYWIFRDVDTGASITHARMRASADAQAGTKDYRKLSQVGIRAGSKLQAVRVEEAAVV